MIGQDHGLHWFEEPSPATHPVSPAIFAGTARPATNFKTLQQHRVSPFQNFGVCQTAIGHMGMHRVAPVKIRTCTRSATQRFVILMRIVAIDEIVHRTLCGGHDAKRTVKRIGDNLRGLDITRNHCGRILRLQHTIIGKNDGDRL